MCPLTPSLRILFLIFLQTNTLYEVDLIITKRKLNLIKVSCVYLHKPIRAHCTAEFVYGSLLRGSDVYFCLKRRKHDPKLWAYHIFFTVVTRAECGRPPWLQTWQQWRNTTTRVLFEDKLETT